MYWIEVSLETDGEAAEAVADLLQRYGYQGVVIEQVDFETDPWEDEILPPSRVILRAYLPENDDTPRIQRQLEEGLWHLSRLYPLPHKPDYQRVAEEDWAEAWKEHYHPLRVGTRIYIRPAWNKEPANPDDIEIILDPGMAFGTGTHPSTQLCLLALEALGPPPLRVLDLGCGSGILAIAAAKFGAARVWALDTDEMAVRVTNENATLNHVGDTITAQQGSLENLLAPPRRFGLILVNILAKVIIPMCENGLWHIVQPGGVAIFSGLIEEQAAEVEKALRGCGLIPYHRRTMGEWVCIEAKKTSE